MNVTDGTAQVWCLHCAMRRFIGCTEQDLTQENEEAFIFNVTHGYIGDQCGGCLTDASLMVFHPANCADCGEPLQRTVPVIADRFRERGDFQVRLIISEEQGLIHRNRPPIGGNRA